MTQIIIHIILSILTFQQRSFEQDGKFTVAGIITTSSSYCGGAAPDPDLMRELQKTRPFSGIWLYLKEGTENNFGAPIIDSAMTNNDGFFRFLVDTGEYVIITKQMLDPNITNNYLSGNIQANSECLDEWQKNGLATIQISDSSITNLRFHFGERCFLPIGIPCLVYTGPMPP